MNSLDETDYPGFCDSLLNNVPCLVNVDTSSEHWAISKDTFLDPDTNLMHAHVPVDIVDKRSCTSEVPCRAEQKGPKRIEMSFSNFLRRVTEDTDDSLYLKDWHFDRYYRQLYHRDAYTVPLVFQDDWLNHYYQHIYHKNDTSNCNGKDDYAFCYIGTKNSFTGIHHDVLYSYSWSINLVGTKKWTLWSPLKAQCLLAPNELLPETAVTSSIDIRTCNMKYFDLVSDAREQKYDKLKYPDIAASYQHYEGSEVFTVIQQPGQALFVPSGWYHQVENILSPSSSSEQGLDLVISINRNWFNAFNLPSAFHFFCTEWINTRQEILHLLDTKNAAILSLHEDLISQCESVDSKEDELMLMNAIEWHVQCEKLLKSNCSMDTEMMMELLICRAVAMSVYNDDQMVTTNGDHASHTDSYSNSNKRAREQDARECLKLFCPSISCNTAVDDKDCALYDILSLGELSELFKRQRCTALNCSDAIYDGQTVWTYTIDVLSETLQSLRSVHSAMLQGWAISAVLRDTSSGKKEADANGLNSDTMYIVEADTLGYYTCQFEKTLEVLVRRLQEMRSVES